MVHPTLGSTMRGPFVDMGGEPGNNELTTGDEKAFAHFSHDIKRLGHEGLLSAEAIADEIDPTFAISTEEIVEAANSALSMDKVHEGRLPGRAGQVAGWMAERRLFK